MARGTVNRVVLAGNLGADPDTRFTPAGTQVTTASLATDETWTDRSGETRHRAEWHRLVLWGRLAEIASQYWKKGLRVHVEGRLQTRSWVDPRGQRHQITEVVVCDMHMPDSVGGPGELDLLYRAETPAEVGLEGASGAALDEDVLPF
ncbi:MAG: single-stranded DNA-binding protein [Gemmatimonadota bacterium]